MWEQLKLVLWKNLIIRRRHWFLTLIEIAIPILLFTIVAYGRSKISGLNKSHINETTYHEIDTTRDIYSHLNIGELKLWYSPYTEFTEAIILKVQEKLQIPGEAVREFRDQKQLFSYFTDNTTVNIAAINFNLDNPHQLNYDLTIHDEFISWNTDKLYIPMMNFEDERSSIYIYKGFAALQIAVDLSFMELFTNTVNIDFNIQQFPDPPRTIDSGINQLFMLFLPLITIFSFMFLCPAVLQRVGEERKSGAKEYMKMVGLKSWVIWLGWSIHALSTYFISIIIIVILMKVPFWGVSYAPIEHTDGTIYFLFLFFYCMASITFCFLLATIVKNPSIATVVGVLVWLISYFVPQAWVNSHEFVPWQFKIFLAVLPNMALYFGYSSISVYELRETGIQWGNLLFPGTGDSNDVTMGNVFFILIFDTIFFMLLTAYIENIKPGKYGIAKPYHYPLSNLKRSFMKCFKKCRTTTPDENSLLDFDKYCILIKNLTKKYPRTLAVDISELKIHKNQITVLLGQNGAGKTTMMSIITGMIHATSGHVLVDELNIEKNTDEVRKKMGLCTQHNLLFRDLTVLEHLIFFAKLKGAKEPKKDAVNMLEDLGLEYKRNKLANTLSGGMKRKLCLGMALIGKSEVLVLDEPTSGLDPESRRKVWDLLLKKRKEKTILITTHFMEEADVLADQIVIMDNGCVQCNGTPSELKKRYNTGYHLCLLLKSEENINAILETIRRRIPGVQELRRTNDSLVCLMPFVENIYSEYKIVIDELEKNQEKWGIKNIGITLTTLNDVFLKARDETDSTDGNKREQHDLSQLTVDLCNGTLCKSFLKIFALMKKRYYFLKKKFYWFIPSTLISATLFLLVVFLSMSGTDYNSTGGPSLNLSLNTYGDTKVYYGGLGDTVLVSNLRQKYSDIVSQQKGLPKFKEDVSAGIIQEGIDNIAFYKKHLIASAEFNLTNDNQVFINAMYSSTALHGAAISINLAMNSIIKTYLNDSFSIITRNTPFKALYIKSSPSELSAVFVGPLWLLLIPMSIFFILSNFIMFPHSEVSTNFLKLQINTGLKIHVYWIANLLFDVLFAAVIVGVLFGVFILFNITIYHSNAFTSEDIDFILIMIIIFIFISIPYTYLLSYRKTITAGFTSLLMFGFLLGIVPTILILAMESTKGNYYAEIAKYLKPALIILAPQFGLSYVCVIFSKKFVDNYNWRNMDAHKRTYICEYDKNPCCVQDGTECRKYMSYFENDEYGLHNELLFTVATFFFYFFILLLIETECYKKGREFVNNSLWCLLHPCFQKPSRKLSSHNGYDKADSDSDKRTLSVKGLTKKFGGVTAVKNLAFSLKSQKCLGLLGVNGAGKSTTFRVLTKYFPFNQGEIKLKQAGKDCSIKELEFQENIGYCPQEDALNFVLTGRELLKTMALLRGYSEENAEEVCKLLLDEFDLEKYADKPCSEYSGGNKRKLCTCIAFLGHPSVILLDEPTSGVDPASRKRFWNILQYMKQKSNSSFLLCSHSMEECENLCDEIAIMKEGKIEDSGSLLKLKNKYQQGFKITISLKPYEYGDDKNKIKNYFYSKSQNRRNEFKCVEEYGGKLTFQTSENRLSQIFNIMKEINTEFKDSIQDSSVSQISLEDIFLKVADSNSNNQVNSIV